MQESFNKQTMPFNLQQLQSETDSRPMSFFRGLMVVICFILNLCDARWKFVREAIHILSSITYDSPVDFKSTSQLIKSKIIERRKIISGQYKLLPLQSTLEAAAGGKETRLIITI